MTEPQASLAWLEARLDRDGADLDAWPDRQAASEARRLILASPEARQAYELARTLEERLDDARERLDAALVGEGAPERVLAAVLAALPAREAVRLGLRRVAAILALAWLVGVGLGTLAPGLLFAEEQEVLVVEALLFGPEELEP